MKFVRGLLKEVDENRVMSLRAAVLANLLFTLSILSILFLQIRWIFLFSISGFAVFLITRIKFGRDIMDNFNILAVTSFNFLIVSLVFLFLGNYH